MAIVNVRPVSGFVFDKDSLESLKRKYDFVRRYEINEDTITFYFDEVSLVIFSPQYWECSQVVNLLNLFT